MKTRLSILTVCALIAAGLWLATAPPAEAVEGASACPTWKQTRVTVGTSSTSFTNTAGTLPTGGRINSLGQLAGRRYITVCQSKATSSTTAVVQVRVDGYAFAQYPVEAGTYADGGAVDAGLAYYDGGPEPSPGLAWGDCVSYPVPESVVPRLLSSEASTIVSVFECGGAL